MALVVMDTSEVRKVEFGHDETAPGGEVVRVVDATFTVGYVPRGMFQRLMLEWQAELRTGRQRLAASGEGVGKSAAEIEDLLSVEARLEEAWVNTHCPNLLAWGVRGWAGLESSGGEFEPEFRAENYRGVEYRVLVDECAAALVQRLPASISARLWASVIKFNRMEADEKKAFSPPRGRTGSSPAASAPASPPSPSSSVAEG